MAANGTGMSRAGLRDASQASALGVRGAVPRGKQGSQFKWLALLAVASVLYMFGCASQSSHAVEKTIRLPDSLGCRTSDGIAYSTRDNCVLVHAWGRVLVMDAETGRKIALVPAYGPGAPFYDPMADEVRLSSHEPRASNDARRDSVLSALAEARMMWPEEICFDPVTNRLYSYLHSGDDSLSVLDGRTLDVIAALPDGTGPIGAPRVVCCNPMMHRVYWIRTGDQNAVTVIDGQTNRVIGTIDAGPWPSALCYNRRENKLYVYSRRTSTSDSEDLRTVAIIDCWSNQVIAYVPAPFDEAILRYNLKENRVYCAGSHSWPDTLSEPCVVAIDGASDRVVARFPVPGETYDLVYDATGNRLYCCGKDWAAAIDCRSNTAVASVRTSTRSMSTRAVYCAPVNRLYYLREEPYEVYGIDCARFGVLRRVSLGYSVGAMLYNSHQDKVYCADASGHEVAVIDPAAETIRAIVPVGGWPNALCSNGNGTRVYCASGGNPRLSVIDAVADTVVAAIDMSAPVTALCYSAKYDRLYCAKWDSTLAVIDCRTNSVAKELSLFSQRRTGLLYDSTRDRIYCISGGDNHQVVAIDARTDSVVAQATVKGWLTGLVLDPLHDKAYCTCSSPTEAYVIDLQTMQIQGPLRRGWEPWPLRLVSHPHVVYVKYGKRVAVIDTRSDRIIATVRLPTRNRVDALQYVPESRRLYCTYFERGSMAVIDCRTYRATAVVKLGHANPRELVYAPRHRRVLVGAGSSVVVLRDDRIRPDEIAWARLRVDEVIQDLHGLLQRRSHQYQPTD